MSEINPEKAADKVEETVEEVKGSLPTESNTDKFKKHIDKAAEAIKQEAVAVGDTLKDPAVSTSILAAITVGTGATAYLHQQNRLDKIGTTGQLGIVVGAILVGVVNYFGVKAASK